MRSESGFGTVRADVVVKAQAVVPRLPVPAPPPERLAELPHRSEVGAPQLHNQSVEGIVSKSNPGTLAIPGTCSFVLVPTAAACILAATTS